ncbi:MAG: hypothetical protein ACI3VN_08935 [Candidatus Onthomonas sp.]
MKAWKWTLICSLLALLLGLGGGFALHYLLPPRSTSVITSQLTANAPAQSEETVEGDSLSLIRCALETAEAIRNEDYTLLASYVHPEEGVTFTPASTVDRNSNLTFQANELAQVAESGKTYVWGTSTDAATPIRLTLPDYVAGYVWDRDYTASPRISVDTEQTSGNALENTLDAYPGCHYVEFYCPAAQGQSDWSAIKLVYQWYQNEWYLVGIVHSAWSA